MSKPVKISEFHVRESCFTSNGKRYRVSDLIKLAADLEPFEIPLNSVYIGTWPWGTASIKEFCYHVKRVQATDMSHPVILDDEGYICDGWHRVAKAIIEGKETIMAVRLEIMPEPVPMSAD